MFLAITGGEALYADMGHFGKEPVRIAWFALVWPALMLNYFGQGALLLAARAIGPAAALSRWCPPQLLPWMVILATAATVIASQAIISGAFSMARQAVQLDLLPRLRVLQTSAHEQGQIYVPVVNWLVFLAVIAFVVGFGSSDALTGAYGAAVVGTMVVTTILGRLRRRDPVELAEVVGRRACSACCWSSTARLRRRQLTKVPNGGWIPLTLARDPVHGLHDLAQRAAGAARGARQDGRAAHGAAAS